MKKEDRLKYIYRWFVTNFYIKPYALLTLRRKKSLYKAKSYYPELPSLPSWKIFILQAKEILKWSWPHSFFYMYGLDVKSKEERKEYINFKEFRERRNYLNFECNEHNSTCILRNKLYFDLFARTIGVDTPLIEAYFSNNKLYSVSNGFRVISFEELAAMGDRTLFCKETEGECGAGIFKLTIKDSHFYIKDEEVTVEYIENLIHNAEYLFQAIVKQHPQMSALYPHSINTVRLLTVRSLKDGQIHLMPSILRIGANGSFVDNTSQGGLAVGFNLETGQLNEYGFHKPEFGLKTKVHPDTQMVLHDFYIPFIKEAEGKAIFFHSMLKDIHSIGWDIAIGVDGPIFIEGNDNWEINGPQVGNHGLRKEYNEYFFK